mmetsp:Transcript_2744/g.7185  ORF Transcript_2744/g.7185 Transcript_2744/m.7185 type:complete len:169 (-) Transcript_2744:338-844(-)
MKTSTLLLTASLVTTASAFAPASHQQSTTSSSALDASRRSAIEKFGAAAWSTAAVLIAGEPAQAADAQEEEFNELISVLKARSEENKEANANYAMRSDKLSDRDFKDIKMRRPKLIIVSTVNGNKIFTQAEFSTLDQDGKIVTSYGVRQKQGGGDIPDYNDITYTLKE